MSIKAAMVVEDDEGFQLYMKVLIQKEFPEIELIQAYDGREVLDYCNDQDNQFPDIILLDLNMPGMNGFELLEEWKKTYKMKETKIVVLTSSDEDRDKDKVKKYDFIDSFVIKPVSRDALVRLLSDKTIINS